MLLEQYKTLYDVNDYQARKPNISYAEEPISTDQFNVNNKVCHVISSNTKQGFFTIPFSGLSTGDIIEVECEFRSINGTLPKIGIDEMNGASNSPKVTFSVTKAGEWVTLSGKYVVQNNSYSTGDHRAAFGLFTADEGEFYMRNAKVKCYRNTMPNPAEIEENSNENGSYIRFPNGTQICYMRTAIVGVIDTDVSKTILYPAPFVNNIVQKSANITNVSGTPDYHVKNLAFYDASVAAGRLSINTNKAQTYTIDLIAIGKWK